MLAHDGAKTSCMQRAVHGEKLRFAEYEPLPDSFGVAHVRPESGSMHTAATTELSQSRTGLYLRWALCHGSLGI